MLKLDDLAQSVKESAKLNFNWEVSHFAHEGGGLFTFIALTGPPIVPDHQMKLKWVLSEVTDSEIELSSISVEISPNGKQTRTSAAFIISDMQKHYQTHN